MPGSGLKVCVVGGGGGGVRTKFSVQLWSQAEQLNSHLHTLGSAKEFGPFSTLLYLFLPIYSTIDYYWIVKF